MLLKGYMQLNFQNSQLNIHIHVLHFKHTYTIKLVIQGVDTSLNHKLYKVDFGYKLRNFDGKRQSFFLSTNFNVEIAFLIACYVKEWTRHAINHCMKRRKFSSPQKIVSFFHLPLHKLTKSFLCYQHFVMRQKYYTSEIFR